MKDWRRVPDWGEELPQHKGGREVGWGRQQQQQPPPPPLPAGSARSSNSKSGKPPPAPGSWQPTVPSWEKRFCTRICRIPWRKICETKRLMSYYSSVLDWDDSAGKEAFDNAKARFFAKINGLPCDISLPGPDIYIDEINWDVEVDPQLLLDLDKEFIPGDEAKDCKIGFLSSGWDRAIPCTGWGDADDVTSPVRDGWANNDWANSGENGGNVVGWDHGKDWGDSSVDNSGWVAGAWNDNSGWAESDWVNPSENGGNVMGWDHRKEWGDGTMDNSVWVAGHWNDNSGCGARAWEDNTRWGGGGWEDNSGWRTRCCEGNFQWRAGAWEKSLDNKRHSDSWRQQDNNRNNQPGYWDSKRCTRKREGDGLYGSRSPAFRHQRDDFYQHSNNHWRNSRGRIRKRANYQNEQPTDNEHVVPRQWNAVR